MRFDKFFIILITTTVAFADTNDIWKCSDSSCTVCAKILPVCLGIDVNPLHPSIKFKAFDSIIKELSIGVDAIPLCFPFEPIPATFLCIARTTENLVNYGLKICIAMQVMFGPEMLFQFPLACFKLDNEKLSVESSHLEI